MKHWSAISAAFALAACAAQQPVPPLDAVNPASAYCVQQGGKTEIRQDEYGNEYGVCRLPDGLTVDEWEYYRSQRPEAGGWRSRAGQHTRPTLCWHNCQAGRPFAPPILFSYTVQAT